MSLCIPISSNANGKALNGTESKALDMSKNRASRGAPSSIEHFIIEVRMEDASSHPFPGTNPNWNLDILF